MKRYQYGQFQQSALYTSQTEMQVLPTEFLICELHFAKRLLLSLSELILTPKKIVKCLEE